MTRSRTSQAVGLAAWWGLVLVAAAVAARASVDAASFYTQLDRPTWAPPASAFGPVWSVLYALMATSAWLVWRERDRKPVAWALALFVAQLVANALWSWLFFGWRNGTVAFARPSPSIERTLQTQLRALWSALMSNARHPEAEPGMRMSFYLFVAAALLGSHHVALAAGADSPPFDGMWSVTLTCPAHNEDEDAKGYVHRFPAEVKDGVLRGTHATEGQPGWHFLSGTIGQDGTASLKLEGIVNNAEYSVNHAHRGKPYVYRVRAKFEPSSGVGQRVGKRKCEFQFRRV